MTLERVEILEGGRKELRRGVRLSCDLISDYWDEDVSHQLVDLSLGRVHRDPLSAAAR